jgi:hypothetical protein
MHCHDGRTDHLAALHQPAHEVFRRSNNDLRQDKRAPDTIACDIIST